MPLYQAYGCVIDSVIPLPFLKPSARQKKAAIKVRIQKIPDSVVKRTRTRQAYSFPDKTVTYEPGIAKIIVRNGREILLDPDKGVAERALYPYISPKIGVALHQQGCLMLHASAVEIKGRAVAFLGGPHWGKSTTVALLNAKGHPLVTDDALAIRLVRGKAVVYPGYPRLKLWPDSLKYMKKKPGEFPRLMSRLTKRVVDFKEFDTTPRPLGVVYLLDKGPSHSIARMPLQDAFIEATRHNYNILAYKRYGIGSKFGMASELVKKVPFFRLKRKIDKRAIPSLIDLIEKHAAETLS